MLRFIYTVPNAVIPANAGIQLRPDTAMGSWTPAFAGVTVDEKCITSWVKQI